MFKCFKNIKSVNYSDMNISTLSAKIFIVVVSLSFLSALTFAKTVLTGEQSIPLKHWTYKIDPDNQGRHQHWLRGQEGWHDAIVPHNWDLDDLLANYKGKVWYKTSFSTLRSERRSVVLFLEAVSMSYKVFINGTAVGGVMCGNYEEEYNLTKYLKYGVANSLVIEVDNALKWGAYWNWGGIRRIPRLLLREHAFISHQRIETAPDLNSGMASVKVGVTMVNTAGIEKKFLLKHALYFEGKLIAVKPIHVSLKPHQQVVQSVSYSLSKDQVRLWDMDHPYLYSSTCQLMDAERAIFSVNERFGIRKIEVRKGNFYLNGEKVRLAGYNWVADDRTTGNQLPEFRFKEDIDLMKIAGANMARLSHRPLPRDVMDYLDEKGILVIAEFNNWPQFLNARNKESEVFVKKLIDQNFNHPCIIGWSVGNEMGNKNENPEVNDYVEHTVKYIKSHLDPTRLVSYASNTADWQNDDAAKYCDFIMINKYDNYDNAIDSLRKKYKDKAIFMSEYGGHATNLIYDTPNATTFRSLMVDRLKRNDNMIGYALWTFNDYRSGYQAPNPATTTPIHQNRQWGIVDVYRNKKRAFQQIRNFYAPVEHLQLSIQQSKDDATNAEISITPRGTNDIPSFNLRGYVLVWETEAPPARTAFDFINLPDIHPGDPVLKLPVKLKNEAGVNFVKVSLLSPTGYVVKDTTVYLAPPLRPQVSQWIRGDQQVRVLFEKNKTATSYRLHYLENKTLHVGEPTIDHYLETPTLTVGKSYKIWLTAINDFGESMPSDTIQFLSRPGYVKLPPVIWLSEPADHGFFTGISYHYTDYGYQVRYGSDPALKDRWTVYTSSNWGMIHTRGLTNFKNYYYQVRSLASFSSAPNAWSEIKTIVPNPSHSFGSGYVEAFKQKGNSLLIGYRCPHNASQYLVSCRTNSGQLLMVKVNQSIPELIYLPNITTQQIVKVEVVPVN